MGKHLKTILIISGVFIFAILASPAFGKNQVLTNIKVIHASTGSNYLDPSLKSIISELKSVFKYTSYKLLKKQQQNLQFNQNGSVELPGNRSMIITPLSTENRRIKYQIDILKKNRSVFQTRILLKNNNSITIGGPKFKKGYLLFNISGSLQ